MLRKLPEARPELLTGARYFWGGLWLGAAAVLYAASRDEPIWPAGIAEAGLPVLALQGVLLSYGGTMLWYQAISRLDLARATAIVVPSIPLLSLATAFVIVGEVPSPRQGLGLVLVAAGVLSFVRAPHAVETRERQREFLSALGALQAESLTRFGKTWLSLDAQQKIVLLTAISTGPSAKTPRYWKTGEPVLIPVTDDKRPPTLRDRFELLKERIAQAYYSSEKGMKELGWTGNMVHAAYPGCTHEGRHRSS